MTRYEVNGWYKSVAPDSYEEGEDPYHGQDTGGDDHWYADTLPVLIDKLMDFAGTTDKGEVAIFREDDGTGRIDIQTMETADGFAPMPADLERWKQGTQPLFACYWIFVVERVTRETLTADQLKEGLPDIQD